jgi:hypothetical protein
MIVNMNAPTQTDRTELDRLHAQSERLLLARDSIPGFGPDWRAAHKAAGESFREERAERVRLWKLDRWGAWMKPIDRELATITGELTL